MKILFYVLILVIFILSFLLIKESKLNLIMTLICSLLIIKIASNPKVCIDATFRGSKLFFNSVFVSLFPFLIITNIMIQFDGVNIYSKLLGNILCKPLGLPKHCTFPIIVSFICGYPLGAKYSCELYEKNLIDLKTLEKLLNIASNASPLFIVGAVGASMLNNHYLGYLLLASNYISCIFMGLIIKNKGQKCPLNNNINKQNLNQNNIGKILKSSIENSTYTSISIGGFIILFSVLVSLLKNDLIYAKISTWLSYALHIPYNLLNALFIGTVEMTNGCNTIASLSLNLPYKLIIISFFLAFGGFSITSQIYSFTYKHNISMKKYMLRKVIQGFISSIVTFIMYKLLYNNNVITSTFYYHSSFYNAYKLKNFIFLIILALFPIIIKQIKKLFIIS